MSRVVSRVKRFLTEEDAPTMAEYGLLLGLIAIVVIIAAFALGSNVSAIFKTAADSAKGVPTGS